MLGQISIYLYNSDDLSDFHIIMSISQFNSPERKRTEVRGMGLLFGWTDRENSKLQGQGLNFYREKPKWAKKVNCSIPNCLNNFRKQSRTSILQNS